MCKSAPAEMAQEVGRIPPATRKTVHVQRVGLPRGDDWPIIRVRQVRREKAGRGYSWRLILLIGFEVLHLGCGGLSGSERFRRAGWRKHILVRFFGGVHSKDLNSIAGFVVTGALILRSDLHQSDSGGLGCVLLILRTK